MSLESIQKAFDDYLKAKVGTLAVAWPGQTFKPDLTQPHLKPVMSAYTRGQVGIGARYIRHTGTYKIELFAPANKGVAAAARVLDPLLPFFAQGTSLSTSDGHSITLYEADVKPPVDGDPKFLQVPVLVPWWCDEF